MEPATQLAAPAGSEWAVVSSVIDGDTVELTDGRKVRLIGVDAPEMGDASSAGQYEKEAAEFTRTHLTGRGVLLEYAVERREMYGRTLAYLWLGDGLLFNGVLVREGYAKVMPIPPNVKYSATFLSLEQEAIPAAPQALRYNPGEFGGR